MPTKYMMNEAEKNERTRIKAIHERLRASLRGGGGSRHDILAWCYAKGFAFRRCERQHHVQTLPDGATFWHDKPDARLIWKKLVHAGFIPYEGELPKFAWTQAERTPEGAAIAAWIDDPTGAIPAPPPRAKKPHAPAERAVATAAE